MCGNGVRCLAKFAEGLGLGKKRRVEVQTLAGNLKIEVKRSSVKVQMPDPKNLRLNFTIFADGKSHLLSFIDTGVPHAVKFLETPALLKHVDVKGLGRAIRFHATFEPKGTNVNFACIESDGTIRIRTYERGVEAETAACGTGSTASALIAAALKGLSSPVKVCPQSGEALKIFFTKQGEIFSGVSMEGPVRQCFEGRVEL